MPLQRKIFLGITLMTGLIVILLFYPQITKQQHLNKSDKYFNEGKNYQTNGQYDKAIEMYNKALAENPENYNAYLFRGRIYFYSQHFKEAKDDLENSIRINPNGDSVTYSDLSWLYTIVYKDYSKSVEYATKSLQLNSVTNYNAYLNRGRAYLCLKQYEKAISDFESVLKIKPNEAWAVIGLAHGYRLLGKYDKAINELNTLVNTEANQSLVFYWLSVCYQSKGDKKLAERYFKKYQELQVNRKSSDK